MDGSWRGVFVGGRRRRWQVEMGTLLVMKGSLQCATDRDH